MGLIFSLLSRASEPKILAIALTLVRDRFHQGGFQESRIFDGFVRGYLLTTKLS